MNTKNIEENYEIPMEIFREIAQEEIEKYMRTSGKKMIAEIIVNISEKESELEKTENTEQKEKIQFFQEKKPEFHMTMTEVEKYNKEGISAQMKDVIMGIASKMPDIFKNEEVESEEGLTNKILEFIAGLKKENRKINNECREKINELNSYIESLRREYTDKERVLIVEIEEKEKNIKSLNEQILTLNSRIVEIDNKYMAKERMFIAGIEEKEKRIAVLNEKIEELKVYIDNLSDKCMVMKRELHENTVKSENEIAKLSEERQYLQNELKQLHCENEQLNNCISSIKYDAESFRQNAKNEITRLQGEITDYKAEKVRLQDLYRIAELYDRFMKTSKNTRDKLEKLIRIEDVGSFATCCYQLTTMEDIWDFVNVELRNGTLGDEDCRLLAEIFIFFIEQKNKMYAEAAYRICIPEKGEYFDATKHLTTDRTSGDRIKEVVFPGYGLLEKKSDSDQLDEERKFKKIKKLAIVKTM